MDDVGEILMKQVMVIIILTICILMNSGCTSAELIKNNIDNQQTANDISDKVIKCINDDDLEELKKLFCEQDQSQGAFDNDVKYLFDCIDGKIISYDINYRGEESLSVGEDGKIERQRDGIRIENIVVDSSGGKYVIRIYRCTINTEDRTEEGITSIELRDSDNKNIIATVGCN